MLPKNQWWVLQTLTIFAIAMLITSAHERASVEVVVPIVSPEIKKEPTELERRREVWLSALEWCESRGIKTAINEQDKDGTPSYYSFQFKPGTFRHYGQKYKLFATTTTDAQIMDKMKDYDLMRDIVRRMTQDKDVKWSQEFPDCVNRFIGRPPIK